MGCSLEFESLEGFQEAGKGEEAKEVFADIENFSDKKPSIVAGEVKGVDEA